MLVWVAISEDGIALPFIYESSIAIDANRYINKFLKPKLVKFINSKYKEDEYVFWPDLASAHYAKKTIDVLKANNIVFVDKHENPPNVPQARPIETFWANVCSKVYQGGWQAKTKLQLIRKIKKVLREFDPNELQDLMKGIRAKLRKIADKGPYSIF